MKICLTFACFIFSANALGYGNTTSRFTGQVMDKGAGSIYCVKDRQSNQVSCSKQFNRDEGMDAKLQLLTNSLDQDESGLTSLPSTNFSIFTFNDNSMQLRSCGSWDKRIAIKKQALLSAQESGRSASCPKAESADHSSEPSGTSRAGSR